jgi:hypothetical protein
VTLTLALLEEERALYSIDVGVNVSAHFHIGRGYQTQGHDPNLGGECLLIVCKLRQ